MKKNRDYRDYLQDIVDAIKDIADFIGDLEYAEFVLDRKTLNAVARSVEVIGEAAKNISGPLRKKYPGIPWKKMAGMRDKLTHEYFGIDNGILWKVAKEELPPLKNKCAKMLKELGG